MMSACIWLLVPLTWWCQHASGCWYLSHDDVNMHVVAGTSHMMMSTCIWLLVPLTWWCQHASGCWYLSHDDVNMHLVPGTSNIIVIITSDPPALVFLSEGTFVLPEVMKYYDEYRLTYDLRQQVVNIPRVFSLCICIRRICRVRPVLICDGRCGIRCHIIEWYLYGSWHCTLTLPLVSQCMVGWKFSLGGN